MMTDDATRQEAEKELAAILGCSPESLPTIPATAMELSRLAQDEDSSVSDVVKVISQDPPLASRIITLANSPLFGTRSAVKEIDRAVVMVGMAEVSNLAMGLSLISSFASRSPLRQRIHRTQLWSHSFATGIVAEILGRKVLKLGSGFFLYGLVHDIGKVAIESHLGEKFGRILTILARGENTFSEVEMEVLGVDHSFVGSMLFAYWGLPEDLYMSVGLHHRPWKAAEFEKSASLIFLADLLAQRMGRNSYIPNPDQELSFELKPEELSFLAEKGWDLDDLLGPSLADELSQAMDSMEASGILS